MAYSLKKEFSEDVRNSFRKIFSSLLPHENYDRDLAYNVLVQMNKILETSDVYGYDHLLYKFILAQFKLRDVYSSFIPDLSADTVRLKMEINLQTLVTTPEFDLARTLAEFGVTANVDIPDQFQMGVDFVYSGVLALYDELLEMATPTTDGLNELVILKDSIINVLGTNYVSYCAELWTTGLKFQREFFTGYTGFKKFSELYLSQMDYISKTIDGNERGVTSLMSLLDHKNFNKKSSNTIYPLFGWGIPPIDEKSPIMNSDVVTVIGDEGTGKTHFVAMLAANCIIAGKDVIVMTGETSEIKMYHMILSNYICQKRNHRYEWKELLDIESLPEEDRLLVNKSMAELASNEVGNIHLIQRFTYETFTKEVCDIINQNRDREFGAVLIDHIGQPLTNGNWTDRGKLMNDKQRVDYLYYQSIIMGDDLNVAFIMIAHTGSEAASQDSKGKATGTRIGGLTGNTTKDADVAIWMRTTDAWKKQGLVQFVCKKFREAKFFDPFMLKIRFDCSQFEYSDVYQITNSADEDAFENEDELY